jgi:nucleotide-binding universal stress UspA family protein
MTIRKILALVHPAAPHEGALERAQLLAAAHSAALEVARLASGAARGSSRLGGLARQAQAADLVVLPRLAAGGLANFLRGHSASQLLRACGRPVLVARAGPAHAYGSILVATGLEDASMRLLDYAARLQPDADLELFHALSVREEAVLRSAEVPAWTLADYRARRIAWARRRLSALVAGSVAAPGRLRLQLGRGDPGQQLAARQRATGAPLIVVGKSEMTPLQDFLCASVAARVLGWSGGDVLVLPMGALHPQGEAGGRPSSLIVAPG